MKRMIKQVKDLEYKPIVPVMKESLEEIYGEDRPGNHFSDLVVCPRLRVFRDRERFPLTNRELNFFTSGKAIHESYEALFTKFPDRFSELEVWVSISSEKIFKVVDREGLECLFKIKMNKETISHLKQLDTITEEDQQKLEFFEADLERQKAYYNEYLHENGIFPDKGDFSAHVDLYDRATNQPYEAKSSRTAGLKEPKSFHIQQLKYYMTVLDAEWGGVFYQYLLNFGDNPFQEFPIHMTKEEKEIEFQKLLKEGRELHKARVEGKPELARHVMNDLEFNSWKCTRTDRKTKMKEKDCPYYDECYKINFPKSKEIKLV